MSCLTQIFVVERSYDEKKEWTFWEIDFAHGLQNWMKHKETVLIHDMYNNDFAHGLIKAVKHDVCIFYHF